VAARNIRPRVLTAVYELGTFTVSELCRAAGLADRNQAYSQLDRLEERGFLEKKTVPAGARHAPFKQYTLVSDPVKRSEFAQEITAYRPLLPVQAESELGRLAIEEAQQELDRAEKSLLPSKEPQARRRRRKLPRPVRSSRPHGRISRQHSWSTTGRPIRKSGK